MMRRHIGGCVCVPVGAWVSLYFCVISSKILEFHRQKSPRQTETCRVASLHVVYKTDRTITHMLGLAL